MADFLAELVARRPLRAAAAARAPLDSDILVAMDELVDRVWHNRYLVYVEKHRSGEDRMSRETLRRARESARKIETKYGRANLGPYSDFDWGMINGKLSALRWVLGEDWDELYT